MIVERMEQVQERDGVDCKTQCAAVGVPYSSFKRWKQRADRGEAARARPGPKKVEAFDMKSLQEEIRVLRHGRKRSAGVSELYERHRDHISRRDLQKLVDEERRRQNRERNRIVRQVTWKAPRLIWSMDDTEYKPFRDYPKAYLHNVEDLGSRYKFDPLVGLRLAHGEEIAKNLLGLFERFGPPLFLKRDNHGNLNHRAVNEILGAFLVLPLNSPSYYPQYNGGIEVAQREIKRGLSAIPVQQASMLAIHAQMQTHTLNHDRRPCLGNRTSCQLLASGRELAGTFTKRKRKEVYDAIRAMTLKIIEEAGCEEEDAWRYAVEIWLQQNGFITVRKQRKV